MVIVMTKRLRLFIILFGIALLISGCCLSHEWQDATCMAPKKCAKCGETEGEPLSHTWIPATCTTAEMCNICNTTRGKELGHIWVDATCTDPKICLTCNTTEGTERGHQTTDWELTSEPANGKAGVKTKYCKVCDEVVETTEFYYPYFNMSFNEFVQQHNNTYASHGWKIKEVSTGFSYFMNSSEETAIIFHSDLNGKTTGTATAYSKATLEKFNSIQIRVIDHGATSIDADIMATVMQIGGIITQPLANYELQGFLEQFVDDWVVTRSSNSLMEGEAIIGGYKYILRAYTVNDYYSRVFYEWICQTTY